MFNHPNRLPPPFWVPKLEETFESRRSANMEAPINAGLPIDVIPEIVLLTKPLYDPPGDSFVCSMYYQVPDWIRCVPHVCTYWRMIALSRPLLWSGGFPRSMDGIRVFLERSKNLPVISDACAINFMLRRRKLQTIILPHMGRAKEIYMNIVSLEHINAATKALDVEMPYLQVLKLVSNVISD